MVSVRLPRLQVVGARVTDDLRVDNSRNIFEGNNLGCFVLQAQQQDFPDMLKGLEAAAAPLLRKSFKPLLGKLNCPQLNKYNQGLFNQFPGYKYHPKGS